MSRIPPVVTVRPDYWSPADPVTAATHNIKGQLRRTMVKDIMTGRAQEQAPTTEVGKLLAEVEPGLLADELDEHLSLERIDPQWMGGEYLPRYGRGEVEIARIVMNSTTMDVISIRARRSRGRIAYRVVDEYDTVMQCSPKTSRQPLTTAEALALLDSIEFDGAERGNRDFFTAWWDFVLSQQGAQSVEDLWGITSFLSVESPFYPALSAMLEERAKIWVAQQVLDSAWGK